MKEELSSFDIAAIIAELDPILNGLKIDNVYQLNPKTLLLKLRGREGSQRHLVIEAGRRVHITSYIHEKPLKPRNFCMALRKYLRDGRIEGVQQYDFERIVEIAVTNKGEQYHLITELFGGGNIILADSEKRILHALSYRRMKDRNILRGEVFAYPPSRGEDPRKLHQEDFRKIGGYGQLGIVRAIARFLGIGGTYAEEVLLRAKVAKNTPCSSLSNEGLDDIFNSLLGLMSEIASGNEKPRVYIDEKGNWIDVAPADLKRYSHLRYMQFQTFNEALDEYYVKVSVGEKVSGVKEVVEREVARLQRILEDQEETLRESKEKAEAYRKFGDAIYLHLNELQLLIESIMRDKRGGKSWQEIAETLQKMKDESRVPAVYFQALNPKNLSLQVSPEGQLLDLDLRLSAQKNAGGYYAKAKRAARKIGGVEKAIKQTQNRIEETRLQITEAAEGASEPPTKRSKREWYERFHWFHSSDGLLVIGGRDATTNEILIKKYMSSQDLVFHADIAGAPFVLAKTESGKPPEETVKEAAQFAASYSRAWKEALGAIDVYWVKAVQVSKTPPSGEYLPRGSFMIYGTRNYVKGVPLEVAVGLRHENGWFQVVAGPLEAIAKQTKLYVRLVPGRESSGRLAKQIRSRLAQLASDEQRKEIIKTPLEEIQRFIPAGRAALK